MRFIRNLKSKHSKHTSKAMTPTHNHHKMKRVKEFPFPFSHI